MVNIIFKMVKILLMSKLHQTFGRNNVSNSSRMKSIVMCNRTQARKKISRQFSKMGPMIQGNLNSHCSSYSYKRFASQCLQTTTGAKISVKRPHAVRQIGSIQSTPAQNCNMNALRYLPTNSKLDPVSKKYC